MLLFEVTNGAGVGPNQQTAGKAEVVREQFYTVAGRAVYSAPVVNREFSYDFTLTVGNNWWGMEFVPVPLAEVRYIQNCDGSNLVAITYFQNNKKVPKAWNDGYVEVDNRKTPVSSPEVAHAVFVGFAAQFYLPAGTNGLVCPLWHPEREVNQAAFVKSDWRLMAPGRPETVRCRYEAQKWNEVLHKHKSSGSTEVDQLPLAAIYSSINQTNFEGGVFPAAYAFRAFAPDREDGKDKASPVYEIQVTNVILSAAVEKQLFERNFRGVAVVADYRGGRREPLTYNITNSAPPRLP